MRNIAIIPARSGSKGLKDKNIRELKGIPLLGYSIHAACESGLFDEIMVSTDSEKYAEIAKSCGAKVPFLRSEELSGDRASSWDVVKEVLMLYRERFGRTFQSVCLLQPTSPLRTANNIREAYSLLQNKSADAITSVCQMEHSPLWSMTLPESLSLEEYRKNLDIGNKPRQLLDQYYRLNGAIYIRLIDYEKASISLYSSKEYAYIMDSKNSVDIDTIDDFGYAEFLLDKSINQ